MGEKTRIIVHVEGGTPELYVRGEGGGAQLDKGSETQAH